MGKMGDARPEDFTRARAALEAHGELAQDQLIARHVRWRAIREMVADGSIERVRFNERAAAVYRLPS